MKNTAILLSLIFISLESFTTLLHSQSSQYIEGKVINKVTSEPVAFATVRLRKNQLGVYANSGGDFKIISSQDFQNDSLIITCIGFKRYAESFNTLKHDAINKFYLDPSEYGIGEVKISAKKTRINSSAVIAKAIKNIKVNYSQSPFNFISYYRDYQKRDGNYINLNEALVQTLDNGFSTKSNENKYRLLDFRENMDFPRMSITPFYDNLNSPDFKGNKNIPYANLGDQNGNELFILMVHDALRDFDVKSFSFINTFASDFLFNHEFSEPLPVYNDNLLLYKINFKGKAAVTGDLIVRGAIYIQPKNYSIHKIEYSCFFKVRKEVLREMFNIDIEYGYENAVDSLMHLKYISFNNLFNVNDKSDNSWFKITSCHWAYNFRELREIRRPVVTVGFNNTINVSTALAVNNYNVKIGKKTAVINSVKVADNQLVLELRNDDFPELDSVKVLIKNLEDIHGNILDKQKTIELYQYRELFVQGYNDNPAFHDSCYMRFLPLEQNCITKYTGKRNYWMNSPESISKKPVGAN
jgi:hypothetical protein